jgi:hypothetical protein
MTKRKRKAPAAIPLPARIEDITGQKFGRLTVLGFAGYLSNGRKASKQGWHCRCSCGGSTVARGSDLRAGKHKSCGCTIRRHGRSRTPEYIAWQSMRRRCTELRRWEYYGSRGIKVCDHWNESFEEFVAAVGPRPSPQHSIDRIDNDGDYVPGNVRWATAKEQMRNTRMNRLLSFAGKTLTLVEWGERTHLGPVTISQRLKRGWSIEDALTKPPQRYARAPRAATATVAA